jgi:hypothetical protein
LLDNFISQNHVWPIGRKKPFKAGLTFHRRVCRNEAARAAAAAAAVQRPSCEDPSGETMLCVESIGKTCSNCAEVRQSQEF